MVWITNLLITGYSKKIKFTLEQATKTQRGDLRYSSTLSLTLALDGVGGQRHAPAALPPEKTRYPLYRRLGWPQGRTGYGISRSYGFIHLQIYGLKDVTS
jgi:hypothetical protein